MPGVYGDQLSAFPELMEWYTVFNMRPHIGAGYGERFNEREVYGYWSRRKMTRTGIEGGLNVPDHQATFWVQANFYGKTVKMEQNDFVEVDGELHRVVHNGDFTKEGGFYKCLMQVVKGVTDQQVTNRNVDMAVKRDY